VEFEALADRLGRTMAITNGFDQRSDGPQPATRNDHRRDALHGRERRPDQLTAPQPATIQRTGFMVSVQSAPMSVPASRLLELNR